MNESARWPRRGSEVGAADEEPVIWDGRFRILRTLGEGGMGRVHLAEDLLQDGRKVALKRLLPAFATASAEFVREFQVLRCLAHPGVPRAFELGFADENGVLCPYFTLEPLGGIPLPNFAEHHQRGVPPRTVAQIGAALLQALDHVHRQGWVHGDVKPANVLVHERPEGLQAWILDFGAAARRMTPIGDEVVGTPEYAAPELLRGEPRDGRMDLYAVGLLLFELIEGRRPWDLADVEALHAARAQGPVPPLSVPTCPPRLATLIRRLLAADPDERPQTAEEAFGLLQEATGLDGVVEPPDAFLARLLTVPLPWRSEVERLSRRVFSSEPGWAYVVDAPPGYFARRLLGPILDAAATAHWRIVPVRFERRSEAHSAVSVLVRLATSIKETRRPMLVVAEHIDQADDASLQALMALVGSRSSVKLVATRQRVDAGLPQGLEGRPGVITMRLQSWSNDAIGSWVARAIGDIGAPWERDPATLPATPAALFEALGALYRAGKIARRGAGYAWFPKASLTVAGRDHDSLEGLLAVVRKPVPERALAAHLGAAASMLPKLIADGVVRARGDGTLALVDEARWGAAYQRLMPAVRRANHRRLAQALEETGAEVRRVAEEWLASDTPLHAVPHVLTVAESRPGRASLKASLGLIARARALVAEAARAAGGGASGAPDLDVWRYEALVVAVEARVLLASGEVAPLSGLVEQLGRIGAEHGHRHTIEQALLLRIQVDLARRDVEALVADVAALVGIGLGAPGAQSPAARARMHWARALRHEVMGVATAALAELDAGLAALGDAPESGELRITLVTARAELAVDAGWLALADEGIAWLEQVGRELQRSDVVAVARLILAQRLRLAGRFDEALATARAASEMLPRGRAAALEARVEAELAACRVELADFGPALEHAQVAAARASECALPPLRARVLMGAAVCAWYGVDAAEAWRYVEDAQAAIGTGEDPLAVQTRLAVLAVALGLRGAAVADDVAREASAIAWRARQRALARLAATGFRLAAEAALVRRRASSGVSWAREALSALDEVQDGVWAQASVHHTLGRAQLLGGDRAEAERSFQRARALVHEAALAIADVEVRDRWLSHPERRAILGAAGFREHLLGWGPVSDDQSSA